MSLHIFGMDVCGVLNAGPNKPNTSRELAIAERTTSSLLSRLESLTEDPREGRTRQEIENEIEAIETELEEREEYEAAIRARG